MKQWDGKRARQLLITISAVSLLLASACLNLHHLKQRQRHVTSEVHLHLSDEPIIVRRRLNETNSTQASSDTAEDPPCSDILLHQTPTERCHHALHCDGEYLMQTLLPYAFCLDDPTHSPLRSHPKLRLFFPILFPIFLITTTLLLFRLLGSTAESYFSPALEMISSEFQIPPPLAGVTLLALGNGSPDVSAVMNAIKANSHEGIPLSLGELTGGGMFVQSVVVGRIVSIGREGEKGVLCHAELIRDMCMYTVAASYVFWMCEEKTIYYRHVVCMFVLYGIYVGVVVAFEVRRYYMTNESNESIQSDEEKLKSSVYTSPDDPEEFDCIEPSRSQEDEEDNATLELSPSRQEAESAKPAQDRKRDPPGSKHSARIIRVIRIQEERMRKQRMQRRFRPDLVARRLSKPENHVRIANMEIHQRTWSISLFIDALHELGEHLYQTLFIDACGNTELSTFERTMVLLESPFVLLRKFVTPLPCEGDYNRAMVASSIALSPFWLLAYLAFKLDDWDPFHIDTNLSDNTKVQLPLVFWPVCLSLVGGCLVVRYAPSGNTTMSLRYTVPIALYGFLIAATWIDVISDQLVNILEFVGVVLRIPSPIMGMTVLAWGNSVGDYSTNSALAQKGFSGMSMAACFAGPSFNLLIGLGSGLLSQKELLLSDDGLNFISMAPSVKVGFAFLIFNCILGIVIGTYHKGIIPSWSARLFFGMYMCYMTMNAQLLVL